MIYSLYYKRLHLSRLITSMGIVWSRDKYSYEWNISCVIVLWSLIILTFLGTINLLHFTLLFVFISFRYHIIF